MSLSIIRYLDCVSEPREIISNQLSPKMKSEKLSHSLHFIEYEAKLI